MALVQCPECKKEVSDQATVCIHCGYPLKTKTLCKINGIEQDLSFILDKSIEKTKKIKIFRELTNCGLKTALETIDNFIEKQEIPKELTLMVQTKDDDNAITNNANTKNDIAYKEEIKHETSLEHKLVTMPKQPHFQWKVVVIFSGLGILVDLIAGITLFSIILIPLSLFVTGLAYSIENDKYKLAQKDYNMYLQVEEGLKQKRLEEEQAKKVPICPHCNSNNTYRITELNRALSIATVGLASSKIGKQYGCHNCKHKW